MRTWPHYFYCYCVKPSGDDFCNAIAYQQNRQKAVENNIEDVYDGTQYQSVLKNSSTDTLITFKHNTDGGIAVFRSSGKDMWPILLELMNFLHE